MSNFNSKFVIATVLTLSLSGCVTVNAKSLDFKEIKNLNLSAKKLTQLNIDAAAGYLKIIGDDSISDIQVTANIEAYNDDFKLSLKSKGGYAELVADANPDNHINWGSNNAKIDLIVRLPSNMRLKVKDGSGEITIHQIKNDVEIDDGSGSMKITDIQGNLKIDDGSGSMVINQVSGDIKIDDGSGSMNIEKVGGTLNIEDGSGNMDITDVFGLVTIDDGSGDINLKTLHNGLTIIEEGSGDLKMSDIKGPVSMK